MSETRFKARLFFLAPVLASLLSGVFYAALFHYSGRSLVPITVLPEAGFGPLFNAVVFVTLVGVGGTIVYLLLKIDVQKLIRLLIGVSISVVAFIISVLYLEMLAGLFGFANGILWIWIIAVLLTAVVDIEFFCRNSVFYGVIVMVFGGALGAFLGASIPYWSAILILILLAFYDVIAVFKGPLGKLAVNGMGRLRGIVFSFKEIQMGLGDLTFYSMLTSRMLFSFGWLACFAALIGVLFGSFLGFKMLERNRVFPGLPFSVIFGLVASYVVIAFF
jgi:presenilin-like A22 family membrane protease